MCFVVLGRRSVWKFTRWVTADAEMEVHCVQEPRTIGFPPRLKPRGGHTIALCSLPAARNSVCFILIITIIIMYIYHAVINALSAHIIHINLNMIFYTHIEHSPTKTIYIKYYTNKTTTTIKTHTHTPTHTHTHTVTVAETGY